METVAADEHDPASVIRIVALWTAEPDRRETVREILGELSARSLREPGCLAFEVLEATDRPGGFVLLERYAGAAGHAAHLASEHFAELVLRRAVPILSHRDVRTYDVLSPSGPGPEPGLEAGPEPGPEAGPAEPEEGSTSG